MTELAVNQAQEPRPEPPLETELTRDDFFLLMEIEQFYYREAALLDGRQFHTWVDLFTDDLEYWMPVRSTRQWADEALEFTRIGEAALFDDTKAHMEERIRKLDSGFAWSEDPPSRVRHIISNVRLLEKRPADEFLVASNFIIYRTRLAQDEDLWVGRREDILRKVDGAWRIARRHIFLDQVSLSSKNLSIFF
jgi:3-phenylpropionate/cinnamic acid dioxygenase small subunit